MSDRPWVALCAVLAAGAIFQVHNLGFELQPDRARPMQTLRPAWCAGATAACFGLGVAAAALAVAPAGAARRWGAGAVAVGLLLVPTLAGLYGLPDHASYTTDSTAYGHHGAERVLAGESPYATRCYPETHRRFEMPPYLATRRMDGRVEDLYPYPAGSFLVCLPFVWLGLTDVRWLALAALVGCALLLAAAERRRRPDAPDAALWPVVLLACYPLLARQTYGSVNDAVWALPMIAAWLALPTRPLAAGLLVGLALTVKQTPYLLAPFVLVAAWRLHGPRRAAGFLAASVAAFAAVNAPWALPWLGQPADPALAPIDLAGAGPLRLWLTSALLPFVRPIEPTGLGLVAFERYGLIGPLGKTTYTALSAGAYLALVGCYAWRWRRLAALGPVLGLLPTFLAWRSNANYLLLVPLLLFVGPTPRPDPDAQ